MTIASIYWLGPYASAGEPVVDNAVAKAELILQAPTDGFLKQVAIVESQLGLHDGTFDGSGGCGIWQVDPIGLKRTKDTHSHPELTRQHHKIWKALGLEWKSVQCDDLNYPLLGALAARLYLMTIPESIPEGLEARAKYWKKYYNTNKGSGTDDDFIRRNSG
jgi:hypothetical protein